ncbi:MAG: tetratricopeptide repeat protein, partial [Acidobacteriota bacterium]
MPRPPQPASRSQCRPNFGRLRRIWAGPTAKSAGSSAAGWIVAAVFAVASGAPTTPATAQEGPQDTEGEARLEAIAYELRTATREESARAVELGQEALELLGPESPESLELRLTCGLCRARHWNDEFETGIALGGRCVELAERLEDRYWLASGLLWCLGQGYSRTGQPGLAAAHQVRAVKIYEEIGPPRQLATALTRAGMDLSDLGDPTQAFDFQLRALEIFTQTGDTNGQAQALLRIGSVHLRNGDHERALEYSRRAYNAFASIDYDVGAAAALHNVGVANMQLERYDRALELLEESLAIKRRLGQPRSVALCLL